MSWNIAIFSLFLEILVTVSFWLLLTLKSFRKHAKVVFFKGRRTGNLFCGICRRLSHHWLEAGRHEYQYSGWGRAGVRAASWSLEDSLWQRILQLTTVSNLSMAVTSPHLQNLDLKCIIDQMNLRLSQQLLPEQEVGWDQPEMPIKLRKPPKGAQGLYHKNILLLDLRQNWSM